MKRPENRDIVLLAGLQSFCFVALTQLEPRFVVIHLYQLIPYVAILLFVAYHKERWAYMIGPLVSLLWLGLAYMAGLLGSAITHVYEFGDFSLVSNVVSVLALTTAIVAVALTIRCGVHWSREFAGQGLARQTFFLSLVIVLGYYGVLLHWFWDMIPNA